MLPLQGGRQPAHTRLLLSVQGVVSKRLGPQLAHAAHGGELRCKKMPQSASTWRASRQGGASPVRHNGCRSRLVLVRGAHGHSATSAVAGRRWRLGLVLETGETGSGLASLQATAHIWEIWRR